MAPGCPQPFRVIFHHNCSVKIAVNTRFLIADKLEGIGWFTYESLKHIVTRHPEHEFYFLFDRPFDRQFVFASNVYPEVLSPPARHPLLWYLWFEWAVPRALGKIKPDLFLSTDGFCSLRTDVKQLMVLHDLAFEHFHNHVDPLTLRYYRYFTPRYAQKATRIVTVSEFTRQDLIQRYLINPAKVDVAWNGSNDLFHPLSPEEQQRARDDFASGAPYFLYAGAIQPRKNIINTLRAFELFKEKTGSAFKLILAGRNWNYTEALQVHAGLRYKNDVVFAGHLSRSDLSRVMGGAFCLVYVSLFEGFGIPIVEAMNCDVPVITSNSSSMPEVAGEAALLCDPSSVEEIALSMSRIYETPSLRDELIARGRIRRSLFSWQLTAEKLWTSVLKAME